MKKINGDLSFIVENAVIEVFSSMVMKIDVTNESISARLSFNGKYFACYIPMEALWAAFKPETMQGMMWPDSMPAEVAADLKKRQEQQ